MSTPLMRQYAQVKAKYPDTILLFRMGDFFETFDDDAKVAARVLDAELPGDRGDRARPIAREEHRHEAVVRERAHDLARARAQGVAQREHGERPVLAAQHRDGRRLRHLRDEGLRARRQRTGDPGHERRPAKAHPAALHAALDPLAGDDLQRIGQAVAQTKVKSQDFDAFV